MKFCRDTTQDYQNNIFSLGESGRKLLNIFCLHIKKLKERCFVRCSQLLSGNVVVMDFTNGLFYDRTQKNYSCPIIALEA